ncbi:N-acetylmuramoyl-L-alanine amidase [candidate division KSB1 bacterium]
MKHFKNSYLPTCLLSVFLFSVIISANVFAAGKSKHVVTSFWYKDDTVSIYLSGSKSKPTIKQGSYGNVFYIDIFNSKVLKNYFAKIDLDDVKTINRAENKPTISRIVINFNKKGIKPNVEYKTYPEPHIFISWYGTATKELENTTKRSSNNSNKFRVLIDPGHGGFDPGVVGPNGTEEKKLTLDIALKLEQLLKDMEGVEVKLTRRTDKHFYRNKTKDLNKRKEMAKNWNADLFLSIHLNGNKDKGLRQTEIYYSDANSYSFAKTVRKELVDELERRSGKLRKTTSMWVIKNNPAKHGSVLVESCYLSNYESEQLLKADWYQDEIAKGLRTSIESYLNAMNQQ